LAAGKKDFPEWGELLFKRCWVWSEIEELVAVIR
jgi:hypothetical protein